MSIVKAFFVMLTIHPAAVRIVKTLFAQFYLCHLMGCMWLWVESMDDDARRYQGWIHRRDFMDPNDETMLYVSGVYWAFSTITTVGYGDIAAFTIGEMIMSIICMIIGVTYYGFVIGSVTSLLESFDKKNIAFDRKYNQFVDFVYGADLTPQLKERVEDHFKLWKAERRIQSFLHESEVRRWGGGRRGRLSYTCSVVAGEVKRGGRGT